MKTTIQKKYFALMLIATLTVQSTMPAMFSGAVTKWQAIRKAAQKHLTNEPIKITLPPEGNSTEKPFEFKFPLSRIDLACSPFTAHGETYGYSSLTAITIAFIKALAARDDKFTLTFSLTAAKLIAYQCAHAAFITCHESLGLSCVPYSSIFSSEAIMNLGRLAIRGIADSYIWQATNYLVNGTAEVLGFDPDNLYSKNKEA